MQTSKTDYITFPAGARVEIKRPTDSDYFDVGAILNSVNATLNWTESFSEGGTPGITVRKIKDMTIDGSFTLVNLDPNSIHRMSGGIFERTSTTRSEALYAGQTLFTLTAFAMRITQDLETDGIRQLELLSVNPTSGGFQFNFKGANEEGLDEINLTYTGQINTIGESGRQALAWTIIKDVLIDEAGNEITDNLGNYILVR